MAAQCKICLRGITAMVSPAGCPRSVGVIAVNCRQKVPAVPLLLGGGGVRGYK